MLTAACLCPHLFSEELVRRLCLHFAAINRVSDELLASGETVVAWVQEIFSRAYSLQVVARWVHTLSNCLVYCSQNVLYDTTSLSMRYVLVIYATAACALPCRTATSTGGRCKGLTGVQSSRAVRGHRCSWPSSYCSLLPLRGVREAGVYAGSNQGSGLGHPGGQGAEDAFFTPYSQVGQRGDW